MSRGNKVSYTSDGFSSLGAALRRRNTYSKGFYTDTQLSKSRTILDTIYRNSWVAAKVVDSFAEDMTKDGIRITGLSPDAAAALQKYLTELGIWSGLTDTIKWSRLYGGALAYFLVDGQDPTTPLDPTTVTKDQFLGLEIFDRHRASPSPLGNENRGEPLYYDLDNTYYSVHRSRVIKMIGVKLPYYLRQQNQYWGDSILERIYDRIVMRDNAIYNTGQMINRAWLRTVKIEGLRNILTAGGKAQDNLTKMFAIMRDIQDNAGMTLMDNLDTFQTDSYSFSGLDNLLAAFDQDVAGASDIPMTRLYGQSPAGFSTGDSDLKTYYDKISTAQEAMLREPLTSILIMAYQSLFGTIPPAELDFEFNSPWKPNELEDRATTVSELGVIINAANAGLVPFDKAMMSLREVGKKYNLFSSISDEDIASNKAIPLGGAPEPDWDDEFSDNGGESTSAAPGTDSDGL